MNRTSIATFTAFATLVMTVLACGLPIPQPLVIGLSPPGPPDAPAPSPVPPEPTPVVLTAVYTNAATGVSISYPEDWVCEEFIEQVVFASSARIISGAELESGAAMMLMRTELAGSLTIEDLVETTLQELFFDKIKTSDLKPRTIGGSDGILVTLMGSPAGGDVSMRGFVAGVEHDGWGHLFVAASILDEWSQHGPVLEQMLSSVEFQRITRTYTSPTWGFSITYPDGWLFEEQGEQVIFVTSENIFGGTEFETGAAMLVIGDELGDAQTFEEMVEMILSELLSEDIATGGREPLWIGGRDGIIISFEGTPGEEVRVKGFLAAVEHSRRGYLFVGFSVLDEWCDYGPVLQTMLDSVHFAEE